MRILVTGHRGSIAAPVVRHLARLGYDVTGFDRADGMDLLNLDDVSRWMIRMLAGRCGSQRGRPS
jgi:nucleoside-diphosphate-sugar epimerase